MTREVRHLRPAGRGHSGVHPGETSRGGGGGGAGSASGPDVSHMEESQGVDAWRFLLGLDAESFEEGVDVVARGRPLLPEHTAAMITETVANYHTHDRAIMTVAFVRYLRMMMAEVMQAFEQGVRADNARERGEVLVEVPVDPPFEEGDGSSLMQRTLTGQFASRGEPDQSWGARLLQLQDELGRQVVGERNANIAGLRARLCAHPGVGEEQRSSLMAMLVAMEDGDDGGTGIGDISWQMAKWDWLFGSAGRLHNPPGPDLADTIPWVPDDSEIQDMAMEEDHLRRERERERQTRLQQQEAHEREEEEILQYQVGLLDQDQARSSDEVPTRRDEIPRLSAREYRQWEDWEWFNVLQNPPRKRQRAVVQVTISGASSRNDPWVSRSMTLPLTSPGHFSLRLDFDNKVEPYPDDVETVVLNPSTQSRLPVEEHATQEVSVEGPSVPSVEPHSASSTAVDKPVSPSPVQTQASQPQGDGDAGMGRLEWKDYEDLYGKWRTGIVSDAEVKATGGENLLDLMEAQFILDIDSDPPSQVVVKGHAEGCQSGSNAEDRPLSPTD